MQVLYFLPNTLEYIFAQLLHFSSGKVIKISQKYTFMKLIKIHVLKAALKIPSDWL